MSLKVNMECPECRFVGGYRLDESDVQNLIMVRFECGNCGFVDRGTAWRQLDKYPRTLKQGLRTAKIIAREIGKAYIDVVTTFRDAFRDNPLSITGWFVGFGMFLYHVVPIMTGAILDPEYVAGRPELTNLAIGIISLAFGIYMLRKRWDF